MKGTIKAIRRSTPGQVPTEGCGSGYGFIIDENGQDRFFSHRNVVGPIAFDSLTEGSRVEFEPITIMLPAKGLQPAREGLRADRVQVLA